MRSAAIVLLFLLSMLFLGAQAAQLEAPQTAVNGASPPIQQMDASLLQPTSY